MSDALAPGSPRVWTLGHSDHTFLQWLDALRQHDIEKVVDIRTVPKSKRFPWFDRQELERRLPQRRLLYRHEKKLGGFREPQAESPNSALTQPSMRGFADFMLTAEFERVLERLVAESSKVRIALMCAEADPYRCHRSLLADRLQGHGVRVVHILSNSRAADHERHPMARQNDTHTLFYPGLHAPN